MKKASKIILIILLLLILLLVVGPFLIPIQSIGEVEDPSQLAYPDSQFQDVNGVNIHYQKVGQGEPTLLLLHGFAANTSSWRKVIQPLASADRSVIAFDRPAFGLSERPETWSGLNPYSSSFATQLTTGLMDQLDIEQAVLIGNSAGGTVALDTALKHPDRVKALILVDPSIYSGGPNSGLLHALFQTPQMNRLGPLLARQLATRAENLIKMAWYDSSNVSLQALEGYQKPLKIVNWDKALWEFTKASEDLNLPEQLEKLSVPVLVITGANDQIVPAEDSIRLASEIPNAELKVIQACGHVPQEECPEEFLAAVNDFLARLP